LKGNGKVDAKRTDCSALYGHDMSWPFNHPATTDEHLVTTDQKTVPTDQETASTNHPQA